MVLVSIQPSIEMRTRNISRREKGGGYVGLITYSLLFEDYLEIPEVLTSRRPKVVSRSIYVELCRSAYIWQREIKKLFSRIQPRTRFPKKGLTGFVATFL